MAKVFNWGMFPKVEAEVVETHNFERISALIKSSDGLIARGNGRCYGDSSLQKTIFSTLSLNKFLLFDKSAGILKCQAGVLLDDILSVIVPHGFFLPIAPGTKFITIGGAVSSNIHGKNHHKEGAISNYIEALEIITETGELVYCSPKVDQKLFADTIGGMGLTGIIFTVTIRLKRIETSFVKVRSVRTKDFNETLDLFEEHRQQTYSVAWIDCLSTGARLGQSILLLGEHAIIDELDTQKRKNPLVVHSPKQINVPFLFPDFTLNKFSVKAFNFLYYHKQFHKEVTKLAHYNPFFFPLDRVNNWNRIYGKSGFTQYQFVIPFESGREGLGKILNKIARSGCGSFLAVLKVFGESDKMAAPISFPKGGYVLALDFKLNKKVLKLLVELDQMIVDFRGLLYLTKDVRMKRETFLSMYKSPFNHPPKFNSLQSERLGI